MTLKTAALSTTKTLSRILLSLLIMLCLVTPAFAAPIKPITETTTVKVAFYQLDGFFEYDENGQPCGYGVDYLNELKKYANIEWEFVPVDSWEGIKQLMLDGQVDIRMPVSEPSKPSELYDYSVEPMLMSYHAIMTLDRRDDLFYEDYDKIKTLKIAVCENLTDKTTTGDYLQSIGVLDHLVSYPDYNSCKEALEKGEVDALISNVMDLTDDMKILDKFAVSDNYITTLKGNPCYAAVNDAMTQLKLSNPTFQATLYQKYFPERATEPFTKEEYEYIKTTKSLTVAVYADRKPVSYLDDDGTYQGIAIDLANTMSQKIGIPFTYISIDTPTQAEMLDRADLVMPLPDSSTPEGCFLTQSMFDNEILMAVKDGTTTLADGSRVGVLSSTKGIRSTLESLDRFELISYPTSRDGLNAVQDGSIDAFANSAYVTEWMLQNPRYSTLDTLRYQSFPLSYSICGKADDQVLQSILSKTINALTENEKDTVIQSNITANKADFTLGDQLYPYRTQIVGICLIIVLLVLFFFVHNRTRIKYYRELEESSKKLERASEAKSDFLSRMSHDMRTPMNGILGITHLLHDKTDPEEIQNDVNQIELSANYLLSLINDTLDMSKIEAGKMKLRPEPINSEDLFKNVIATTGILAQQKGVKLNTEFPPIEHGKWVPVVVDAPRLEQIFINIISNAIKFTPTGGTVTLHMDSVAVTNDSVTDRYIVSDTGIGMSEAFLKHIYEPFAQEDRQYDSGGNGTGLGLAIVKQIVDLMGGTITVQSKENEGTTFTIELTYPRYKGEMTSASTPQVNLSVLDGKRVLLCEDNQLNALIATELLAKKGVVAEHAINGSVGVEMFSKSAQNYYDAVLMDIRMPIMDGIEAAKAIRALDSRSDAATVPIIAVTANAFDDDREQTKAAGMDAHLAKPFDPQVLYETLAAYVNKDEASA